MYPSSFMKIFQSFHTSGFFRQFHHIVFHFGADDSATTAMIKISLSVIIDKHAGIDHSASIVNAFDISLYFKIFCRMFACCDSDFP